MKTQAEPLVVRTSQWTNALQIDVVADDYKPPLRELAFDAPGRVRQDHRFHSHPRENTNGKRHVFCRISLIKMDAALHARNGNRAYFPNDQLPRVPDGSRPRKIRDLGVRNSRCTVEFVGKRTKPRTENKGDLRTQFRSGKNEIRSEPSPLRISFFPERNCVRRSPLFSVRGLVRLPTNSTVQREFLTPRSRIFRGLLPSGTRGNWSLGK